LLGEQKKFSYIEEVRFYLDLGDEKNENAECITRWKNV